MKWVLWVLTWCSARWAIPHTIHCKHIGSPCTFWMHRFRFCQIVDCSISPNENSETANWSSFEHFPLPNFLWCEVFSIVPAITVEFRIWGKSCVNIRSTCENNCDRQYLSLVLRYSTNFVAERRTHPRTLLIIMHGGELAIMVFHIFPLAQRNEKKGKQYRRARTNRFECKKCFAYLTFVDVIFLFCFHRGLLLRCGKLMC